MIRNNKIIKSLQKISDKQAQEATSQDSGSDNSQIHSEKTNNSSSSSVNNTATSSIESFLQSSASSSSNSSASSSTDNSSKNRDDNQSSSSSNNDDAADAAEDQLKKLEQSAHIEQPTDSTENEDSNNISSSSNSLSDNNISQSQINDAKQNYQPTPNGQMENNDEQQIEALKNSSSNSNSVTNSSSESVNSGSISASDPATTQQGQKNLAKNEREHQPDLQDITSPNLFIVRARNFHNKMSRLLDKYAYSKNVSGDIINYIISLEDESFKNLCNGFSMIIKDNNRRNNEVEARTEHLQKKASAGAETIKIWQNEGIFANLKDEISELSDVIHDPRFQAFAQKTKTADLNIPKTLKVKGTAAKKNVDKAEAQSKQTKGGKK